MPSMSDSGGVPLALPDSVGWLRIPRGTTVAPLEKNPHGRHLVLEDSTVVDISVTSFPAGGLVVSGSVKAQDMSNCEALVAGHAAYVTRATLVSRNSARVYLGMINVMLADSLSVDVAARTGTAESRDAMIGLLASSLSFRRTKR